MQRCQVSENTEIIRIKQWELQISAMYDIRLTFVKNAEDKHGDSFIFLSKMPLKSKSNGST
jgi:hypothetical protein